MDIKKLIFSALILLLTQLNVFSQSDTLLYKKSVGIDATFINNFLPFDNTIGSRGNYLVHYIKYGSNDHFFRQAFDIDVFGSFENNESDIDRNDARFNIDYKISSGKRKKVFKNGYILYGSEVLLGYFLNQRSNLDNNDSNQNSFNTNLDQTIEAMFGPFLGLEFKISKRVSIYTEAGFYVLFSYGTESFKSDFSPDRNFKNSTLSVKDVFDLPGSIILFYSF